MKRFNAGVITLLIIWSILLRQLLFLDLYFGF